MDQSDFSPIELDDFLEDLKRLQRAPLWLTLPGASPLPVARIVKCEVYGSPEPDTIMLKVGPDDYLAIPLSSYTIQRATLDRKTEIVMSYQLRARTGGPPILLGTSAPYPSL